MMYRAWISSLRFAKRRWQIYRMWCLHVITTDAGILRHGSLRGCLVNGTRSSSNGNHCLRSTLRIACEICIWKTFSGWWPIVNIASQPNYREDDIKGRALRTLGGTWWVLVCLNVGSNVSLCKDQWLLRWMHWTWSSINYRRLGEITVGLCLNGSIDTTESLGMRASAFKEVCHWCWCSWCMGKLCCLYQHRRPIMLSFHPRIQAHTTPDLSRESCS